MSESHLLHSAMELAKALNETADELLPQERSSYV